MYIVNYTHCFVVFYTCIQCIMLLVLLVQTTRQDQQDNEAAFGTSKTQSAIGSKVNIHHTGVFILNAA